MKLKSLLLGSAAALIAVSGARAADAVVAEPEPMEYVKVCDMYGAGFFYIPGTETCLKFSGYVRADFYYRANDVVDDTADWAYRARVNIDARNETDWGTLRSQVRIQADGTGRTLTTDSNGDTWGNGDANAYIDRALISLSTDSGAWQLGYSDTHWTTFHGYGFAGSENGGYYGYDQALFLDYTYSANGFTGVVGYQDTSGGDLLNNTPGGNANSSFYAGLGYSSSAFSVHGTYNYENNRSNGAYKVSATVDVIENLSLKAWYIGGDTGHNYLAQHGALDYAYGVGAKYDVNSELFVYAGYSDIDVANSARIVLGAQWTPVTNLTFHPEAVLNEDDNHEFLFRVVRSW